MVTSDKAWTESLIADLLVLASASTPGVCPEPLDSDTYLFAYRTGARAAYMDVVSRLQETRPEAGNVPRIGAVR